METPRIVRETTEYEDGTIEERILSRKKEPESVDVRTNKKEYKAPSTPLMGLALLAIGGAIFYLLWKYRDTIAKYGASIVPEGDYIANPGSVIYKAETPRPMVNVDEYVYPITSSGRMVR